MKNDVGASHRIADDCGVPYVASHDVDVSLESFEIRFFSRAEVVKYSNTMSVADEALNDVASDEARAAGYEICLFRHSSVVCVLAALGVFAEILNSRNRVSRKDAKNR